MKKILAIVAIVAIVALSAVVTSCASSGAYVYGSQHSSCGAYGNP